METHTFESTHAQISSIFLDKDPGALYCLCQQLGISVSLWEEPSVEEYCTLLREKGYNDVADVVEKKAKPPTSTAEKKEKVFTLPQDLTRTKIEEVSPELISVGA